MKKARWTKDKRLEFIDFRLQWDGQLNRSDLTNFFGISVPQASLDIADYTQLAKCNLIYDKKLKTYLRTKGFKQAFDTSSPEFYLTELLALKKDRTDLGDTFIKWRPSCDVVPIPERKVPSEILFVVLASIRENKAIDVTYLSKKQEEPTSRLLSPHAIAHDGMRWHVRAYCYSRREFRDFVLARFIEAKVTDKPGKSPEEDASWSNILKLVFVPNPVLPVSHQKVIELEYGMTDGFAEILCREALLYYVLWRLGLSPIQETSSDEQQIILSNHNELRRYIS